MSGRKSYKDPDAGTERVGCEMRITRVSWLQVSAGAENIIGTLRELGFKEQADRVSAAIDPMADVANKPLNDLAWARWRKLADRLAAELVAAESMMINFLEDDGA